MPNVRVVTDSVAELPDDVVKSLDITVVPWNVKLGTETLVDGPHLRTPDFYAELSKSKSELAVIPPSTAAFAQAFDRCARITSQIVVILSSDKITRAVQMAQKARAEFVGRCRVHILDSRFLSCVQGGIVAQAARMAQTETDGEKVVRYVNGLISRAYLAFYIGEYDRLIGHSLIVNTPDVVGSPSGYKPLLLLEDGRISPLPRSRKRGDPIDRMVEFVGEFGQLDRLWTVSTGRHSDLPSLHETLGEQLEDQPFEEHVYGPVVASYFGTSLLGVAALESF